MPNHKHDMKPDRLPMPTVYKCSSCAFRCTPGILSFVMTSPNLHRVVRAGSAQAKIIYGKK